MILYNSEYTESLTGNSNCGTSSIDLLDESGNPLTI